MRARNGERGVGEALAVLAGIGLVATAIVVTYAREAPTALYHVSIEGFAGGLSRAVVFLNFSAALIAIPIAVIAAGRLGGRGAALAGALSVGLCAVVFWPGVVDQADLDARLVNAAPAAGVALAAALALAGWRRFGGSFAPRRPGDPLRLALAVVLLAAGVPWIAAEIGVSFDGVPVLGTLFQSGELRLQPGALEPEPAVHHGHHHGLDGVLLALAALALSRMRVSKLRLLVGAYLALMLAYGLANAVQDWWLEQVVKRGWTSHEIPSLLIPEPSIGWAAIAVAAVVIFGVAATRTVRSPDRPAAPHPR